MKFSHVTISVKDLDESLNFYENIIGLPVTRRFPAGDHDIVFVGNGDTEIELIPSPAPADLAFSQDLTLGFQVESLDECMAFLKEKGFILSDVIQPNPGVKFFFTADPNGVRVQFIQYVQ